MVWGWAMEWSDDAVVLALRRHGETSAIVNLLTRERGRQSGLVRGAGGRSRRGYLHPGAIVRATWRARLAEHLGTVVWEPVAALPPGIIDNAARLAALSSVCALADATLPEREAHEEVYEALRAVIVSLDDDAVWPSATVKWELGLLSALGFGLDLGRCAASGRTDELVYVSPRSGRAVSREAGEPYRDRLLALPPFILLPGAVAGASEVAAGLALTGYFLERHVFRAHGRGLPPARLRLIEIVRRIAGGEAPASPGQSGPDRDLIGG